MLLGKLTSSYLQESMTIITIIVGYSIFLSNRLNKLSNQISPFPPLTTHLFHFLRSPGACKLNYFWMKLNFMSAHNIFQLLMGLQSTGALSRCSRRKPSKNSVNVRPSAAVIRLYLSSDCTTQQAYVDTAFLRSGLGSKPRT